MVPPPCSRNKAKRFIGDMRKMGIAVMAETRFGVELEEGGLGGNLI